MVRTDCMHAVAAAPGLTINSYVWQTGHQEFVESARRTTKLRTRVETIIIFLSVFIRALCISKRFSLILTAGTSSHVVGQSLAR